MPLTDSARYARDAAEAIGARFEDLDDGAGYLFRITRGNSFILGGGGNVCTYPVNSAPAYTISRDKAHTKTILSASDIPIIPGGLFFAHTRRAALRTPGREISDALEFAEHFGYPVFCKPNHGSRGNFAEIIRDTPALEDYIHRLAADFESFLIEPVLDGDEHRVFVLDGRPVFHSTKSPPALIGDGASTLGQLLAKQNASLAGEGISAIPLSVLDRDPTSIPQAGDRIPLPGRRNLSSAGNVESVSEDVPENLARIAIAAAGSLGLRAAAIDLFDVSPTRDYSQPVVIEVNGNPGLRTLELAGRADLIRAIWVSMLNSCLSDT
jgi:glutathione synthase/RimK-type ligase-like ATP-grasp enzyme